ncbi:hypothetical protein BpHYR1_014968 [Brachionus plicatilis]|uniref:Uncharacterized protein n=1 Tax=Brachionus plicatilis TaxID=10195 RepID=A0A3M7QTR4_BRAPC|nr:hypothetical protein BpHYR1_014968 [Brachionus plicatilis]
MFATEASPASSGNDSTAWPGLLMSAMFKAQARPKITKSSKEFAPRRLAPCTEAQAASPQACKPSTTWSSPFLCTITSPFQLVGMPPIL